MTAPGAFVIRTTFCSMARFEFTSISSMSLLALGTLMRMPVAGMGAPPCVTSKR
jgi:hypothetical protein